MLREVLPWRSRSLTPIWNIWYPVGGACSGLIPIPPFQVQYEYETGDHTHLQVYERTIESPYAFSLPAEVGQWVWSVGVVTGSLPAAAEDPRLRGRGCGQ